jgi:hypothetical protein
MHMNAQDANIVMKPSSEQAIGGTPSSAKARVLSYTRSSWQQQQQQQLHMAALQLVDK